MYQPHISVIVPCYKQSQYLSECLQSILDQTYQNWECIIVNDGSPDNTEEIALQWIIKDNRFKYINKKNGGISSAKNEGLKLAKGDWIQFIDCDDMIASEKISESAFYFDKGIDVILTGYRYFEAKEGVKSSRIIGRDNFMPEVFLNKFDTKDVKDVFRLKNPFVTSAPLFRRYIFEKIGGFDERLNSLEDWEFHLRCALNDFSFQHIGYKEETLTFIRLHEESAMRDHRKTEKNLILFKKIIHENPLYIEAFGDEKSIGYFQNLSIKDKFFLFVPPIAIMLYRKFFLKTYS